MGFELSLVVKAKLEKELESDVHLEFNASGSNFAEIRAGSEEFVSDYIVFNGLQGIRKAKFVYGDKDGLIINTIDNIRDRL